MEFDEPKIEIKLERNHVDYVLCVTFSPDQSILCSSGNDRTVVLTKLHNHDMPENVFYKKRLKGHTSFVYECDFDAKGELCASACWDNVVRIWKVKGSSNSSVVLRGHSRYVNCVQFLENPKRVYSGGYDTSIRVWDVGQKKCVRTMNDEGAVWSVHKVDEDSFVSGDGKGKIRIWDFRSGKCENEVDCFSGGGRNDLFSVRFDPNTHSVASGGVNGINVYDIRTLKLLHKFDDHRLMVKTVDFHRSGKYLLSGGIDRTIKIYNLSPSIPKRLLYSFEVHGGNVQSAQFSPDGRHFASGSYDKKVFLWSFPLGAVWNAYSSDIDEAERVSFLLENLLELEGNHIFGKECVILKIKYFDSTLLVCFKSFCT